MWLFFVTISSGGRASLMHAECLPVWQCGQLICCWTAPLTPSLLFSSLFLFFNWQHSALFLDLSPVSKHFRELNSLVISISRAFLLNKGKFQKHKLLRGFKEELLWLFLQSTSFIAFSVTHFLLSALLLLNGGYVNWCQLKRFQQQVLTEGTTVRWWIWH